MILGELKIKQSMMHISITILSIQKVLAQFVAISASIIV